MLAVGSTGESLPHVDEHAVVVPTGRQETWTALERYADESLGVSGTGPLAAVAARVAAAALAPDPPSGFAVAERVPPSRLVLVGRHRFSCYRLAFELADVTGGTEVTARTDAAFPGVHGRTYRALVIGTRVHALVTTGMLRSVRRLAVRLAADAPPA